MFPNRASLRTAPRRPSRPKPGFAIDSPPPARQPRRRRSPIRTTPRLFSNTPSFLFLPKFGFADCYRAPGLSGQHLFTAKSVDDLVDHLDPQARAAGWIDPSVDMPERLGHQIVLHRVAERLQL